MYNDLTNLSVHSLNFDAFHTGDLVWEINGNTLGLSAGIYNTTILNRKST